jgi:hypothetical protein
MKAQAVMVTVIREITISVTSFLISHLLSNDAFHLQEVLGSMKPSFTTMMPKFTFN